ncbi:tRNA (adenosine(37)-N6)-threonylcarbamoyltransferase complex dimerization subunit type 1 TsaB [bacterium]|nr:tRNA (adenosine(37)-N6)-threonylcarbamoyltransferase complex dimerization subunit type 1 TsaB [bacterium]
MRILAVDTSTQVGAVGFLDTDSETCAEINISIGQTHSQRLLSCIDYLLSSVDCPIHDVDVLGVSIGPGSFTGLRIGISVMQGLAFAEGKELTPFSSLEGLAFNYAGSSHIICPMIDARRGEVFSALFRFLEAGMVRETAEAAVEPEEVLRLVSGEKVIFLGTGIDVYGDVISAAMSSEYVLAPHHLRHARGSSIVACVAECAKNRPTVGPADIRPAYLRKSNAELARDAKNGAPKGKEAG